MKLEAMVYQAAAEEAAGDKKEVRRPPLRLTRSGRTAPCKSLLISKRPSFLHPQVASSLGSNTRSCRWVRFAKMHRAHLSCPGRSAAPQGRSRPSIAREDGRHALKVRYGDALQTPISGLPEIGAHMRASRASPACMDRHGFWRSRISDAPLAIARAASHPGHTIASDAFGALFTFQTAHLVPAAHFCVRGLRLCFATPNRGVERRETFGRAPVRRIMCVKDARERAYDAIRQALARRLASHNAGRSPLGAPPWLRSLPLIPAPAFAGTNGKRLTPRLAPHSGSSLEHALDERGCESFYHSHST